MHALTVLGISPLFLFYFIFFFVFASSLEIWHRSSGSGSTRTALPQIHQGYHKKQEKQIKCFNEEPDFPVRLRTHNNIYIEG